MSQNVKRRSLRFAEIYLLQYKVYKKFTALIHGHENEIYLQQKLLYGSYENNFLFVVAIFPFYLSLIVCFRSVENSIYLISMQVCG